MITNLLKDMVRIQLKTATQTSLGQTETWTPVETRYASVIPLDAKARLQYQQLNSEVSHQILMRGSVSLNLGLNRFKWRDKTLEPVEPPQVVGNSTVIMAKEV